MLYVIFTICKILLYFVYFLFIFFSSMYELDWIKNFDWIYKVFAHHEYIIILM